MVKRLWEGLLLRNRAHLHAENVNTLVEDEYAISSPKTKLPRARFIRR